MRFGRSEEEGPAERALLRAGRRETLRRILACALWSAGAEAPRAFAQSDTPHRFNLPPATDLAADAKASVRERIPILLFFDRYDCPYCEQALARYMVPIANDDAWRKRAIYRQVEIDKPLPLVAFDGATTTHSALAARFSVQMTPTVFVVDAAGNAIGNPVVGLLNPDFYAGYLEAAIDAGVTKLRGGSG